MKHVFFSLAIRLGLLSSWLPSVQFVRQFLFCPASNFHRGIFGAITILFFLPFRLSLSLSFAENFLRGGEGRKKKESAIFRLVSLVMTEIYLVEKIARHAVTVVVTIVGKKRIPKLDGSCKKINTSTAL